VAEGVETAEQRDLLYEMGCSHALGYQYAERVAGHEIQGVLASNQKSPSISRTMTCPDHETSRIQRHLQNLEDLMHQQ